MYDYSKYNFVIERQPGFTLTEALRCWHGIYEGEFIQFKRRVIDLAPGMEDFGKFVEEVWDSIEDITAQEAFAEKNLECRRIFFLAVGVKKLFKELEPTLIDKQVLNLRNKRWDADNKPYFEDIEDVYELYTIEGSKLFPEEAGNSWRVNRSTVYAVRCWCTTTKREYWIYVPREVGLKGDALEAIAWTIQLNITEPECLFRQGDIMIAKASPTSTEVPMYHLDKQTYTKLLVSET